MEKSRLERIEDDQKDLVSRLSNFVKTLSGRMKKSNDLIKDLSVTVFDVISYYKELMEAW